MNCKQIVNAGRFFRKKMPPSFLKLGGFRVKNGFSARFRFCCIYTQFLLLLDPASGHDHPFAHSCDHQPIAVCIAGLFQHTVNIGPHRGLATFSFTAISAFVFPSQSRRRVSISRSDRSQESVLPSRTLGTLSGQKCLPERGPVDHTHKVAGGESLYQKLSAPILLARSRNRPSSIEVTITIFYPRVDLLDGFGCGQTVRVAFGAYVHEDQIDGPLIAAAEAPRRPGTAYPPPGNPCIFPRRRTDMFSPAPDPPQSVFFS